MIEFALPLYTNWWSANLAGIACAVCVSDDVVAALTSVVAAVASDEPVVAASELAVVDASAVLLSVVASVAEDEAVDASESEESLLARVYGSELLQDSSQIYRQMGFELQERRNS